MNLPLVTVVVPYHNDFDYIHEAIESLYHQTYSNIEVIVIDDFSSTPLVKENLNIDISKFPLTVIRNSENSGAGYCRNRGIKMANGEIISFLDADDIWMPKIVEKQVEVFLSDPKAVWVYTDGYLLRGNRISRKPNSVIQGFKNGKYPSGRQVNKFHLRGFNYIMFSSNAMKKSALLDVGLFNEELKVSEDYDLFGRLAEKYPVHVINEPLMIYRYGKPTGRHFIGKDDYVKVNIKILKSIYHNNGISISGSKEFQLAMAMIYQRTGIQRLNHGLNSEAKHFLFHPDCGPLKYNFRMICLKLFCFLPPPFFRFAVWLHDHF